MRTESSKGIWSLSYHELAEQCFAIATGDVKADANHKQEAKRLNNEWLDAFALPEKEFGDKSRKATHLASLRSRTIEILIRVQGTQEAGS